MIDNEPSELGLGTEGPHVKRWQLFLIAKGYDPGPADGVFGPRTERASVRHHLSKHATERIWTSVPRSPFPLGIAVLTRNNLPILRQCVDAIQRYTRTHF